MSKLLKNVDFAMSYFKIGNAPWYIIHRMEWMKIA